MAEKKKFTVHMSVNSLVCFGVDTPIQLGCKEQKNAFGGITDQCLKCILLDIDLHTVVAIKMVLGREHLVPHETPRVNSQIVSRFLASLLDIHTSKDEAKALVCKLFKKDLTEGMDEIFKMAILGVEVSRPKDLELVKKQGEVIKIYPFLLDLKGMTLVRHRMVATVGVNFLKKKMRLVVVNGFEWVTKFDAFTRENGLM